MKDRVPTPGQEGRVKITPESGTTFYAKIEMADNPTQAGDEPIKANLLPDNVASAFGLTGNPQVKDALEKIKTLVDGNTMLANSKAKIATGSYVGAGTYGAENPCSLTFDFVPKVVYVGLNSVNSSAPFVMVYPITAAGVQSLLSDWQINVTWDGNTVSWYTTSASSASWQCNGSGQTYYYVAIG